jgi:hypothetical protein
MGFAESNSPENAWCAMAGKPGRNATLKIRRKNL